jgi:hypothetical protein
VKPWFGILALSVATVARPTEPPPADDSAAPVQPAPTQAAAGCPQSEGPPARRRPGDAVPQPQQAPECDLTRLPAPATDKLPPPEVFDRWRLIDELGFPNNWRNPYATNNPLKGDRPLDGRSRFFSMTASSTSLLESRRVPLAVAAPGTAAAGTQQLFASETASVDAVLYSGDTIFRPPDYQLRFTPIFNYSNTRSDGARTSTDSVGAQALFFEKHLRDVSANYDFDSLRIGIQPMSSDFRGFVLADQPLGVRLFGTRDNDVYQYNLGWFRRLPKNANRQNELGQGVPDNDLLLANLYVQDLWRPGLTSEFIALYDRSHVTGTRLVAAPAPGTVATFVSAAPHTYDVIYLGYGVDGHLGRFNLTASTYGVFGHEQAGTFGTVDTQVRAGFAAAELSRDFDWTRLRLSGLYASGDGQPFDGRAGGFDGISQSALFAGADSSFFIHQRLPLVADQVDLKVRDSLFPDLRSSADPGQSNYDNPGLRLLGIGADFDLAPVLRVSVDANHLWFDQTATLATILGSANMPRNLGTDVALDLIYRPLNSQNLIVRVSAAKLFATPAARPLVGGSAPFSAFASLVLSY